MSTGSIQGTVFDSLTMRPLAGANVWTGDGLHSAQADAAGRFRLNGVASGTQLVMAGHPAADSVGLYALTASVGVRAGKLAVVRLAVPSFATMTQAACPGMAATNNDEAVLFGVVRDAVTGRPIPGAVATLTWLSLIDAEGRAIERPTEVLSARLEVVADGAGAYYACGVPVMRDISLQAYAGKADSAVSGAIEVEIPERRILRRDVLVAAPSTGGGAVVIVKIRSHEKPVRGARVALSKGGSIRTDDAGMALLISPQAGTQTVAATAVGYSPTHSPVDVMAGDTTRVVLQMVPLSNVLDTVVVRGARTLSEVERRRLSGFGYAMTGEELARKWDLRSVFNEFPSVTAGGSSTIDFPVLLPDPFNPGRTCAADVYLDGRLTGMDEVTSYRPSELLAVEVFPRMSTIPLQYQRLGGKCGVVLTWSRR